MTDEDPRHKSTKTPSSTVAGMQSVVASFGSRNDDNSRHRHKQHKRHKRQPHRSLRRCVMFRCFLYWRGRLTTFLSLNLQRGVRGVPEASFPFRKVPSETLSSPAPRAQRADSDKQKGTQEQAFGCRGDNSYYFTDGTADSFCKTSCFAAMDLR